MNFWITAICPTCHLSNLLSAFTWFQWMLGRCTMDLGEVSHLFSLNAVISANRNGWILHFLPCFWAFFLASINTLLNYYHCNPEGKAHFTNTPRWQDFQEIYRCFFTGCRLLVNAYSTPLLICLSWRQLEMIGAAGAWLPKGSQLLWILCPDPTGPNNKGPTDGWKWEEMGTFTPPTPLGSCWNLESCLYGSPFTYG